MEKFFCGAEELYVAQAAFGQLSTDQIWNKKALLSGNSPCKSLTEKGVLGVIMSFPERPAPLEPLWANPKHWFVGAAMQAVTQALWPSRLSSHQ